MVSSRGRERRRNEEEEEEERKETGGREGSRQPSSGKVEGKLMTWKK